MDYGGSQQKTRWVRGSAPHAATPFHKSPRTSERRNKICFGRKALFRSYGSAQRLLGSQYPCDDRLGKGLSALSLSDQRTLALADVVRHARVPSSSHPTSRRSRIHRSIRRLPPSRGAPLHGHASQLVPPVPGAGVGHSACAI